MGWPGRSRSGTAHQGPGQVQYVDVFGGRADTQQPTTFQLLDLGTSIVAIWRTFPVSHTRSTSLTVDNLLIGAINDENVGQMGKVQC
jgi:hypothetical protein